MIRKTAQNLKVKGFTMIELLIVIAVLGVLTVAVISAINPIEQVNRSKDTGQMSDAEQLIGATDRYYTSQGRYPWTLTASEGQEQGWNNVDKSEWKDSSTVNNVLTKLSTGGSAELKDSFVTRVSARDPKLKVYNLGTQGTSTYVCFKPASADFREKAFNRCKATADYGTLPIDYPPSACPDTDCTEETAAGDAKECYYCLP